MPDYNNGKIYKIVCNLTKECYVGSTTQPLSKRLAGHVNEYKRYSLGKSVATSSFPILERGNYDIVLLEEVKCDNKEQLHKEERKHIEANVCVNHNMPLRKKKEYREANKDKILESKKKYYEITRDKQIEKSRQYREDNKDKIAENTKERRKKYTEVDKEKWLEYARCYREANKDKINQRKRELRANKKSKVIV